MPTQTSKSPQGTIELPAMWAVNNKPHRKPAAGILDVQNQNS
jgi:hypothetical protein